MRIGVDARELVGHVTGVGQYLGGLLAAWTSDPAATRHEFVLYAPAPLPARFSRFDVRVLPGASGTWWQQTTLAAAARRDKLDVFFAPQYSAPIALTVPTVVVIFDVSFAAHPEWFRAREGLRLRVLARMSARRARAVITISAFSRREIAEHLGVDAGRVHAIPPGIPARTSPPRASREPRMLYVGSIFNRRHLPDLIHAFASVARSRTDAALDLVGDNRTFPFEDIASAIEREALGDRIRWHQYVDDAALAGLYERARAFAFLSEYEGLGLTPLEALTAGVPSVLYDTDIARESCGDAALYVPVADRGATAGAIGALLFDDAVRDRLLAAAPSVVERYNWSRAAAATLAVLEGCR